jgi:hypothetical protein
MNRTAPSKIADFGKEKRRRKCKGEIFVAEIPPSLTSSWRICNKFDFSNHEEINFLREHRCGGTCLHAQIQTVAAEDSEGIREQAVAAAPVEISCVRSAPVRSSQRDEQVRPFGK